MSLIEPMERPAVPSVDPGTLESSPRTQRVWLALDRATQSPIARGLLLWTGLLGLAFLVGTLGIAPMIGRAAGIGPTPILRWSPRDGQSRVVSSEPAIQIAQVVDLRPLAHSAIVPKEKPRHKKKKRNRHPIADEVYYGASAPAFGGDREKSKLEEQRSQGDGNDPGPSPEKAQPPTKPDPGDGGTDGGTSGGNESGAGLD